MSKLTCAQRILHCYAANNIFSYKGLCGITYSLPMYDPDMDIWENIEFFKVYLFDEFREMPVKWATEWHNKVDWSKPDPKYISKDVYFECKCTCICKHCNCPKEKHV